MSCLRKRSGIWYLQYVENGKVVRRSTKIKVSEDPQGKIVLQIQRDFDTQRMKQGVGVEDVRMTLVFAFELWAQSKRRTSPAWQEDSKIRARKWVEWFGKHGVEEVTQITPELIEDYLNERSDVVSAKTLRTELDLLRAAVKLANRRLKNKPVAVDNWPTIERVTARNSARIGAYSSSEVEMILDDLGKWKRRCHWVEPILLLAYLGCRWSELKNIRISDLSLSVMPPVVRIESKKTARSISSQHRYVEIHPRLMPIIFQRIEGRSPGEFLFKSLPEKRDATKVLSGCCKRLGIQYRRLHGFRHYWITTLLSAGVPLVVVMQMAGHRNIATTQRYLHLPDTHIGWIKDALPSDSKLTPKLTPKFAGKKG